MRIRFQASDLGQVTKTKLISFVQNRNRLLLRRWCSGHLFFCSCDSAGRCWTMFLKNQVNVDYCYVPRRVECPILGPRFKHASLRSLTLIWPRRDVPRQASDPSTMSYWSVCTLVRCVTTKDARWVRCSSCSLCPRPRRLTSICSLAAERRGNCVRASWLYSESNASIATRTFVCASYCCCTRPALIRMIFT